MVWHFTLVLMHGQQILAWISGRYDFRVHHGGSGYQSRGTAQRGGESLQLQLLWALELWECLHLIDLVLCSHQSLCFLCLMHKSDNLVAISLNLLRGLAHPLHLLFHHRQETLWPETQRPPEAESGVPSIIRPVGD